MKKFVIVLILLIFYTAASANCHIKEKSLPISADTSILYYKRLAFEPDVLKAIIKKEENNYYLLLVGFNNLAGYVGGQDDAKITLKNGEILLLPVSNVPEPNAKVEFPTKKYSKKYQLTSTHLESLKINPVKIIELTASGNYIKLDIAPKKADRFAETIKNF